MGANVTPITPWQIVTPEYVTRGPDLQLDIVVRVQETKGFLADYIPQIIQKPLDPCTTAKAGTCKFGLKCAAVAGFDDKVCVK
ncbi:hypothetical protein WAI453_010030 [Rhynchosporium graminicola]